MPTEFELPERVQDTIARLRAVGTHAYLVGGALRDALLGRSARDFDLLVDSRLESAAQALPGAVVVGSRPPVLLLPGPDAEDRIEITSLPDAAGSLQKNLGRRDFTLNAIALDLETGAYVDPFGGRADLEKRVLRAVDPERGIRADPVRILRGVRMCFELELTLDADTVRCMERDAWRLHTAAGERLREEIFRVLRLASAGPTLAFLRRIGALACVLPELLRQSGVQQNRHHSEDLFQHSLHVCDAVRPDPVLRLAALIHDAAKPETKRFSRRTQDFSFLRHELLAVPYVEAIATRLRLSKREQKQIERLVQHHLLFPERLQTEAAIRRMLRRVGRDILTDLLELRRADLISRSPDGKPPQDWEATEARIRASAAASRGEAQLRLAIGGKDIMREFGVEEGPEVGRWLRRARRRVLQEPSENERSKLLRWLSEARNGEDD